MGALTSKVYLFKARSWEFTRVQFFDILDSMCSTICVDIRGTQILRILPKVTALMIDGWLSDRTRYSWDSLYYHRIYYPQLKNQKFEWLDILYFIKVIIYIFRYTYFFIQLRAQLFGYIGEIVDQLSVVSFKLGVLGLGGSLTENYNFLNNWINLRENYIWNLNIKKYHIFCIIGCNIRYELPLLNINLYQVIKKENIKVFQINYFVKTNYYFKQIGNSIKTLLYVMEGKHKLCKYLIKNNNLPLFILGISLYLRNTNILILLWKFNKYLLNYILKKFDILNYVCVNSSISSILQIEYGIVNKKINYNISYYKYIDFGLYYIMSEVNNINYKNILKFNNIIFYQSAYYGNNNKCYDFILPVASMWEKENFLINYLGQQKQTKKLITSQKKQKIDFHLMICLILCSTILNVFLFYSNLKINILQKIKITRTKSNLLLKMVLKLSNINNNNNMDSFYLTNVMTKSSKTMLLCEQKYRKKNNFK